MKKIVKEDPIRPHITFVELHKISSLLKFWSEIVNFSRLPQPVLN